MDRVTANAQSDHHW